MLGMPKDYIEMKKKLLVFNLCSLTLLYFLISSNLPKGYLANYSIGPFSINILGTTIEINIILIILIPLLFLAFIFDAIKLHEKFNFVRQQIDIEYIIKPIAQKANITLNQEISEKLRDKNFRRSLMKKIFYEYVGSSAPRISAFAIARAFEGNFWMWFTLENSILYLLAFLFVLIFGNITLAAKFYFPIFILILSSLFLYSYNIVSKRNALDEVEEIFNNSNWKNEVKSNFENFIKEN